MKVKSLAVSSVPAEVAGLRPPESSDREIADVVARLVADVRARGDAALVEATRRFDWPDADQAGLTVPAADLEEAYARLDPAVLAALETARNNCAFFHRHELRADWQETGAQGQKLGIRTFGRETVSGYLGLGETVEKDYSEEVARQIDEEMKEILDEAYRRAETILKSNKDRLMHLAEKLLIEETLEGPELDAAFTEPTSAEDLKVFEARHNATAADKRGSLEGPRTAATPGLCRPC